MRYFRIITIILFSIVKLKISTCYLICPLSDVGPVVLIIFTAFARLHVNVIDDDMVMNQSTLTICLSKNYTLSTRIKLSCKLHTYLICRQNIISVLRVKLILAKALNNTQNLCGMILACPHPILLHLSDWVHAIKHVHHSDILITVFFSVMTFTFSLCILDCTTPIRCSSYP
ncbi:hypothetical protein HMPREF9257_0249 [Eremococcus coleocola ACS-139-V-Col8]|uniref:Uncharacterized protein n=1 Tax=Eremococcus coleocola ACS-139-V-Col8 TaxID=908337 RepID=E4KMF1_9LACT|nr:hypothetical protein HMPREF9257_0249 [Eremococcus coleocola ACS-139-V-Col8]